MPDYQCCNQLRKAIQRVDLHPQDREVKYISTTLNLKDTFESIAIYTHRCPPCLHSKKQEFFYTWVGVYQDRTRGKHGKSKQQKINFDKEPFWWRWMEEEKISDPKGSEVVMGSLAFFPYTLGQRMVR